MRVLSKPDDARSWLHEHNLRETPPTPLLEARLAARQRATRFQLIIMPALIFAVLLFGSRAGTWSPDRVDATSLVLMIAFVVATILIVGFQSWHQHRTERSWLSRMAVRTAHPVTAKAKEMLGARLLAPTVWSYGGGVALGVGTVLLAPQPADRAFGLAYLIGVVVLAGISAIALTTVLRRPSLAEDAESLLVDDVLRAEDTRKAVVPWPLAIAVGAVAGGMDGTWVFWPFVGYVVVGLVLWLFMAAVVDWPGGGSA